MIISHAHRFIFIKTRKTAGTSIEAALRPHLGPDDVSTPIHADDEAQCRALGIPGPQNFIRPFGQYRPYDWRRYAMDRKRQDFKNHLPGPRIRQMIPRNVWDSYFKFCVERHPFDKAVSGYYWSMSERERRGEPTMTLADFLASDILGDEYSDWHRYADDSGIIVDRILSFENLGAELAEVTGRLGLPRLELPKLKSTQRKDRRPATEVLGWEGMLRVEEVFCREIEMLEGRFGYVAA